MARISDDFGWFVERVIDIQRCRLAADQRHDRLAEAMRGLLQCPGLHSEEQMIAATGDCYRTVLLWSDARYDLSLLALVWQCGQRTPIYDHHAACVVGLYQGAEQEIHYKRVVLSADTVVSVGETILRAGSVTVVPPGEQDIHRVEAVAPPPMVTVPLHFYEVDVTRRPGGSSIRQNFQEAVTGEMSKVDRSLAWLPSPPPRTLRPGQSPPAKHQR